MPNIVTSRLIWLDRSGRELQQQVGPAGEYYNHRLSPDGQKVAFTMSDSRTGSGDLWVHDLARDTRTRFTFGPADDDYFVWSPDGRRAAFFTAPGREHGSTFHIKDMTDTGDGESPLQPGFQSPYDWSSDGRFIIYGQNPPTMNMDLWVLPLFGDGKPFPFLQTSFNERDARFSPDGRWIAFQSNESEQNEIYVARCANPREKWRISTSGGSSPRWRKDGKELFYVSADKRVMSVPIRAGDTFEAGAPLPILGIDTRNGEYDVTPDGQRFLVSISTAESHSSPFNVLVNSTNQLKR